MNDAAASFEEALAQHQRSVLRVCRSILRDDELGADAAQETFLRLWRELDAGHGPRRFGAWLRKVAVTASLDLLRRRRSAATEGEAVDDALDPAPDPLERSATSELEARFEDALATLSEGQRTVFLLRHAGGLKLADVADTLGVALPTVKTQFARACLKLQAGLAPYRPDRTDSTRT